MSRAEQSKLWLLVTLAIFLSVFIPHKVFASDDIEKAGDTLKILIPAIGYGSTFYLDDSDGRKQFYKSLATTVAITEGLKSTVYKKRPINKKQPTASGNSFPSGHTSAAFQGASFIHKRYGLKYGIPAYVGASFVGYSRVEADKHYVEDVLVGAAIGIISSFYFTKPYKGFELVQTINNDTYGLSFSKRW